MSTYSQFRLSTYLTLGFAAGTLGFADFFAQHNEHRILFPRLIFFGLGRLTYWNVRFELFVTWFLALVCLFNIWQMTWRSG